MVGEYAQSEEIGGILDENQVLLFDKNGKFRANLFKKGQGPGEAAYVGACLFAEGKAVVQASSPYKLVFFDDTGSFASVSRHIFPRKPLAFFRDGVTLSTIGDEA